MKTEVISGVPEHTLKGGVLVLVDKERTNTGFFLFIIHLL